MSDDVVKKIKAAASFNWHRACARRGPPRGGGDLEDAVQETHVDLRARLGTEYLAALAQMDGRANPEIIESSRRGVERVRGTDDKRRQRGLPTQEAGIPEAISTEEPDEMLGFDELASVYHACLKGFSKKDQAILLILYLRVLEDWTYDEAQAAVKAKTGVEIPQSTYTHRLSSVKDRLALMMKDEK